jgi:hypothetical protein
MNFGVVSHSHVNFAQVCFFCFFFEKIQQQIDEHTYTGYTKTRVYSMARIPIRITIYHEGGNFKIKRVGASSG